MLQLLFSFFAAFQQKNIYNLALKQNNQQLLQERLIDISNPFSVNYGKYWDKDIINMLVEPEGKEELLNQLNNDTIPLEEIQNTYLQGNLYLEHCQSLLNSFEQTITYLDPDTFKVDEDKNSVTEG